MVDRREKNKEMLYLRQGAEASSIGECGPSIRCLKNEKLEKYVQFMRRPAILIFRAIMLHGEDYLDYCSGASWVSADMGPSCPGRDCSSVQSCKTFVGKAIPKNLQSGDNKAYFS